MRNYLVVTIILLLGFCFQLQATDNSRPNIIFILADDLGAGDLHCTGHPYAKSPNLDKLAEKGIRFERSYMAGAWCAPSRFGIMSGQYPAREFDETHNLRADEPSVTKVLKDAGYNTAHIGKWHLTERKNQTVSPKDFGIDSYFISNGPDWGETWTKKQRDDEFLRAKSTDYFVDKAIDFIKENNSQKLPKPFYMNLWVYPTHSYIHPTPEQLKVYEGLKVDYRDFSPHQQEFLKLVAKHGDIDKSMQAYCADITAMDKALGHLFDYLKKEGLDKNTLIVFTSDNGPGPLTPQTKDGSIAKRYKEMPDLLNSVGSAKIYKERKISLHDGGIRTPFIVYWPENTPQGIVDTHSVIHGTDWLPTVAAICNAKLPDGKYDGMDVTSAFQGKELNRDKAVYWSQGHSIASLKDNWKCVINEDGEFQLYDIVKDPSELQNLKSDFPAVASVMERDLRNWHKEVKKK